MILAEPVVNIVAESNTWAAMTLFYIGVFSLAISAARQVILFHNEHVRHYRAKNIQAALEKLEAGSAEYELLQECRAQELVYLNTGLRLSHKERPQVMSWLLEYPITFALLRRARGSLRPTGNGITVEVALLDKFFMYYSLAIAALMAAGGTYLLFLLAGELATPGVLGYLIVPGAAYLLALLMLAQALPVLAAGRLKAILEKGCDAEKNKGKAGQGLVDRGKEAV